MTPSFVYALGLLVALPLHARQELHDRQLANDGAAVRQAAQDPARGVAMYCERLIQVRQGVLCEAIEAQDLAAAQARLMLRSTGDTIFVDGDFFVPADGRRPGLLERGALGFHRHAGWATHEHVCPVVEDPSLGERYVDESERLCVTVTQTPRSKRYLSDTAQGVVNAWAGFWAAISIVSLFVH